MTPTPGEEAALPITAVVASHDEAHLLVRCLPSLRFCDEIIVIDIASSDDTARVAEEHGARVVSHRWVPIAEWARVEVVGQARHRWLLLTDPDEELPPALAAEIAAILPGLPDDVGLVWAPIAFRFRDRPLRGTVWGGENRRRLLARRDAVELTRSVFGGTRLLPGFRPLELPFTPETAIRHHWVTGYRDWLRKHRRYLALDEAYRAGAGHVTGVRAVASAPLRSFYDSFIAEKGYRDGLTGFALSGLWAGYRTASELALLRRLHASRRR